tara:strand:- start:69 stop:653 length:585 start_codon:yes stop_codon:yes gene_type:complete
MSTFFIIFLLTLQSFGSSNQNSYDRAVSKIKFNHVSHNVITLENGLKINVSYHGFSSDRSNQTLRIIKMASDAIHKSFYALGAVQDCKDIKLNVYDVRKSTLNNRSIMTFAQWSNWDNMNVSALYETGYERFNEPAMFVSALNEDDPSGLDLRARVRTIAHETVHYWQDRSCMLHETKSESDAYAFEVFFMSSF